MPAIVRYDEQYCPIARALDVLGDRWTLLILRELVIRDQRFNELRSHLPGIAPTVLTQRLRAMADQDLVTTTAGSPPRRPVYTLTERGRSAVPVMSALARWGMPLMEEPPAGHVVRPWSAANVWVAIHYDAAAATGVDERYRLVVDGEEFTLSSVAGGGPPREPPDLVLTAPARVWLDLRQGRLTFPQARARALVEVAGSQTALANFQRIFRVR